MGRCGTFRLVPPLSRSGAGFANMMTSLEQGPQNGNVPEPNGPVLVMSSPRRKPGRAEIWRRRIFLVVFVLFCLEIGIILTVAPWTPFWTSNSLLLALPRVRAVLMDSFVRGLITGLGLIDIGLAVAEAVLYRDDP